MNNEALSSPSSHRVQLKSRSSESKTQLAGKPTKLNSETVPRKGSSQEKKEKKKVKNFQPPKVKKSEVRFELGDFLSESTPVIPKPTHSIVSQSSDSKQSKTTKGRKQYVENPNPAASDRIVIRRGKERETPKQKKPTPLKRIILDERREKYLQTYPQETPCDSSLQDSNPPNDVGIPQEDPPSVSSSLSESIQKYPKLPNTNNPREYCLQDLTPELNEVVVSLLAELRRFHERLLARDPIKAQSKKRLIAGLREVSRAVTRKKAKAVIIAPNIDEIASPGRKELLELTTGGLDELTSEIIRSCQRQNVPVVFALKRSRLGKAMGKSIRISIVGILDYDGANELFKNMIELQKQAKKSFAVKHPELVQSEKKRKNVSLETNSSRETNDKSEQVTLSESINVQ